MYILVFPSFHYLHQPVFIEGLLSSTVLMCRRRQWWIELACMAALGMGMGIMYLLDPLLVVRVLGAHRMATVMGLSQCFQCLAFTALGPAGGGCLFTSL